MHFLFGLCLIGMIASICSLVVRWEDFKRTPFSPAHVAFCCPTLSHANAVQAYRASLISFSTLPLHSPFRTAIYFYWAFFLVAGTILTITISSMFLYNLPKWTHIVFEDEVEPPAPYETSMALTNMISTGDAMVQPFVSPAVLQANETGALVLTRTADGVRFRRTRKVTALGFEPIMSAISLENERDLLLQNMERRGIRRRNRTLSVPGIDFSYGANLGTDNSGVYGMEPPSPVTVASSGRGRRSRSRANTLSPQLSRSARRGANR